MDKEILLFSFLPSLSFMTVFDFKKKKNAFFCHLVLQAAL